MLRRRGAVHQHPAPGGKAEPIRPDHVHRGPRRALWAEDFRPARGHRPGERRGHQPADPVGAGQDGPLGGGDPGRAEPARGPRARPAGAAPDRDPAEGAGLRRLRAQKPGRAGRRLRDAGRGPGGRADGAGAGRPDQGPAGAAVYFALKRQTTPEGRAPSQHDKKRPARPAGRDRPR